RRAARRPRARLDAAGRVGPRAGTPPAQRRAHAEAADPHAHRAGHGAGQALGPGGRRRRLHHQALLAEGARGADQGGAAPPGARARRRRRPGRRIAPRSGRAPGGGGRRAGRARPDRVPAPALPDGPPRARLQPRAAPRPRLGRPRLHRGAHGGRAHPAPAQGPRAERLRPAHRHGPRQRLRPAQARVAERNAVARIYLRALAVLLAIAGASGLAAVALGGSWGWWTALALLCAWALSHVHMLARLARWLEKPLPEALPEGLGSWEQVLAGLHRHERESARRIQGLAESLARFRHAAEALPDGVVILDAENRIEWCNDTAAAHLGLGPRADVGRPIANLLRQPEFVAYLERAQPGTPLRLALGADAIFTLLLIPYGDDNKLLLSRDVTQNERVETMRRDFVA